MEKKMVSKNGIENQKLIYIDGKENGIKKWYSKSGKLKDEVVYSNGVQQPQ